MSSGRASAEVYAGHAFCYAAKPSFENEIADTENDDMDDYLSKPVRLEDLDTVLRRCLPSKTADATNGVPENQRLQIIDRVALQALRDGVGDPVSFNELFATFLENATKLLAVTSWAVKAGDRAALQLAANTLQLMGAAFGAERLSQLCRELEQMGKEGNLGEAEAKAAQAKAAFSDVRREIQTHWLR